MKILILGGGWYGCFIGLVCKAYNLDFLILDKERIFSGSSSKNQNRLHLGYHYPRSLETIKECQYGYEKFTNLFDKYTKNIKYNIYAIEKNSKINYENYKKIFNISDANIVDDTLLKELNINKNLIEKTFLCDEKMINHNKISKIFNDLFKDNFQKFDEFKLVISEDNFFYDNIKYDFFCNCTYGQSKIGFEDIDLNCFYELCLSFLYKSNLKNDFSYTIMDGDFLSLFSYDNDDNDEIVKLFSLTHVKYTPILLDDNITNILNFKENININLINEKKKIFESEIKKYLLNFDDSFKYFDFYLSIKCKLNSASNTDDRSLKYFEKNNSMLFIGGKITGIFEMINIFSKKINIDLNLDDLKKFINIS
jgi:hypothetical protein